MDNVIFCCLRFFIVPSKNLHLTHSRIYDFDRAGRGVGPSLFRCVLDFLDSLIAFDNFTYKGVSRYGL
jgi:hypothetical protein